MCYSICTDISDRLNNRPGHLRPSFDGSTDGHRASIAIAFHNSGHVPDGVASRVVDVGGHLTRTDNR